MARAAIWAHSMIVQPSTNCKAIYVFHAANLLIKAYNPGFDWGYLGFKQPIGEAKLKNWIFFSPEGSCLRAVSTLPCYSCHTTSFSQCPSRVYTLPPSSYPPE